MSKISFLLPATYSYVACVAKRFQTTSAEERSNENFPFLIFVQNAIILYNFEAEGGGVRLSYAGKFPQPSPTDTFIKRHGKDYKRMQTNYLIIKCFSIPGTGW